jgi:hypothetical protein
VLRQKNFSYLKEKGPENNASSRERGFPQAADEFPQAMRPDNPDNPDNVFTFSFCFAFM